MSNPLYEIIQPLMMLRSTLDITPTWSPNGKSLAFIRWDIVNGVMRLVLYDVSTGKTRSVFESNIVGNVSWTRDSKSLVLAAKRNLAYKGISDKPGSPWPELITMPSYPEIWVLDLK